MASTCVVVADGGRARLFRLLKKAGLFGLDRGFYLEEIDDLTNPEGLLAGRELFSNGSSGRTRAPSGASYETDDHRSGHLVEIERRFARRVARAACDLLVRERASKLVLAVEPYLLGLLRRALPESLPRGTEVIELAQDLSRHSRSSIHELLARRGAVPAERLSTVAD